jgi:hypothetical protein
MTKTTTNNNNQVNIAHEKKIIGMPSFCYFSILYDGLPSSGSFNECHWAIGRRGEASI